MHPATLFTIPTIFARAQGLMGLRQCHGVSQGADKRKILPMEEIAVEFIVLDNKKRRHFHLKDDNVKIWVEVIIVSFLHAVATVDVFMANSNDANLAKTRQVRFWVM